MTTKAKIKAIITSMPAPYKGLIVDTVEYSDHDMINLRVYRDNVESFSDPQKLALAEWLILVRDVIREDGIRCWIEGSEGGVPNVR